MTFLSLQFVAFLLVTVLIYYLVTTRLRVGVLALASIGFYTYWSPLHAVLLLVVTGIIYFTARLIHSSNREKRKFTLAISSSILLVVILGFFKYFDFLSKSVFRVLSITEITQAKPFLLELAVPIGISYYSFKAISYVIDVYWEKIEPESNFFAILAHLAFFPQILSGPVHRAIEFLPQTRDLSIHSDAKKALILSGFQLIIWGLFKKMVIADNLAKYVNVVHASPDDFHGMYSLWSCYFYTFQLYADFSGLTDIAIGMARLFGINTPPNFNRPLFAPNMQEFWRRWHMTLTRWLGDYVFIPLRMQFRNLANLGIALSIMINMVSIGVWHGANWTFVVFGFIHAILMIGSYFSLPKRNQIANRLHIPERLRNFIGGLVTFHLVSLTLNLFRSSTVTEAWQITENIFLPTSAVLSDIQTPNYLKMGIILIVLFIVIEKFTKITSDVFSNGDAPLIPEGGAISSSPGSQIRRILLFGFLCAMIALAGIFGGSSFIYEQF